jgi:hypothetical protein
MPVDFSNCDERRIDRFFAGTMSAHDEIDFERHLETCESCQARLLGQAAEPEFWTNVGDFLRDEPYELAPLSVLSGSDDAEALTSDEISADLGPMLEWLAPSDNPRMIGRLGTYEVMGVIGRGGMGVVLKALDPALNRYVAIKVLSMQLNTSGTSRKRFSREAQASAAVVHPSVIEIHGVAEANGLPYIVMPYVRGASLQKRIDESGPLALAEILRIGMQTAAGLAAAHAQGLVHRDVKPANILLADGVERVLLSDFGLARAVDDTTITRIGSLAGTPEFMSPEQAKGELIDQRSDLFSLGCVMYAMCTGRPPFHADSTVAVLKRICESQPPDIRTANPEIPIWLTRIIAKLLEKKAEDRYQSADTISGLFEQALAHVQQPAVTALPLELEVHAADVHPAGSRAIRAPRLWRTGLMTAVVVLVIAVGLSTYFAIREPPLASETPFIGAQLDQDDAKRPALAFTKQDGLELMGTSDLMTPDSPATIEFWARLEPGTRWHCLAGDHFIPPDDRSSDAKDGERKKKSFFGWFIGVSVNENKPRWGVTFAFTGGHNGGADALTSKWRHYAVCHDESRIIVYIDGQKAVTANDIGTKWSPSPHNIWIGRSDYHRHGHYGFEGSLFAVRVSTICRYKGNFEPPPEFDNDEATAVLLDFSSCKGDRIEDSSGNNRHGRVFGATWVSDK